MEKVREVVLPVVRHEDHRNPLYIVHEELNGLDLTSRSRLYHTYIRVGENYVTFQTTRKDIHDTFGEFSLAAQVKLADFLLQSIDSNSSVVLRVVRLGKRFSIQRTYSDLESATVFTWGTC